MLKCFKIKFKRGNKDSCPLSRGPQDLTLVLTRCLAHRGLATDTRVNEVNEQSSVLYYIQQLHTVYNISPIKLHWKEVETSLGLLLSEFIVLTVPQTQTLQTDLRIFVSIYLNGTCRKEHGCDLIHSFPTGFKHLLIIDVYLHSPISRWPIFTLSPPCFHFFFPRISF